MVRHREFWKTGEVITNRDIDGKFIKGHRHRSANTKLKISESLNGNIPWNKGIPCRKETRIKLSKSLKGKHRSPSTEFKRGHVSLRKGVKLSKETKKKISNSLKGNIPWNKGKTGLTAWNKGKSWSEETKEKISRGLSRHYKNKGKLE